MCRDGEVVCIRKVKEKCCPFIPQNAIRKDEEYQGKRRPWLFIPPKKSICRFIGMTFAIFQNIYT